MSNDGRTTARHPEATDGAASPADGPGARPDPRHLRILDAVTHEAALAACEHPDEPDDELAIRSIYAFVANLTRRP